MHLALYRSERPERFDEIIGQKHIVRILRNQLANGSVNQAYLFTGTRGTGKTTTARILAKAVNCTGSNDPLGVPCCECDNCRAIKSGSFLDVVELDAASNNSVEDIRAIMESVQYPPSVGRYKVYIIDEVHMLSSAAENAFLKTLEEPPEYAIFILATTDPGKVRQTIRSRCMTLNFKRVSEPDLMNGMKAICDRKGVHMDEEALRIIARRADGSVRDALSILEQCITGGDENVTAEMVLDSIGGAGTDFYLDITDASAAGDMGSVLSYIDDIISRGRDAREVLAGWMEHYRDLMVAKYVKDAGEVIGVSEENLARLREQAESMDMASIESAIRRLSEDINTARYSTRPRLVLETAAIRITGGSQSGRVLPVRHERRITESKSKEIEEQGIHPSEPRSQATDTAKTTDVKSHEEHIETHASQDEFVKTSEPQEEVAAPADDLDAIWQRIAGTIAQNDMGFSAMVGNASRITSYENGEITLTVKKNKLSYAEDYRSAIEQAAKEQLGENTIVTMRGGDVTSVGENIRMDVGEPGNEAMDINELAEDIGSVLGTTVEIIE